MSQNKPFMLQSYISHSLCNMALKLLVILLGYRVRTMNFHVVHALLVSISLVLVHRIYLYSLRPPDWRRNNNVIVVAPVS